MIKFSPKQEKSIKDRINAIFTLIGILLFCIHEFLKQDNEDIVSLVLKITAVVLFFWFILGKIASKILFSLIKESLEDQTELEDDMRKRREIHEFDEIEKAESKENIQKVRF